MTTTDDLLAAVLRHPHEAAPRGMLRDELEDAGAWAWPTVLGYVLAHPDADGPRLLAADWLEGDGQGDRADYIRVAVELDRIDHTDTADPKRYADPLRGKYTTPPDFVRRQELYHRYAELIDRGTDAGGFLDVAPAAWGRVTWSRGFIAAMECITAADWLAHADAILAAHPVRAVTLTTWPEAETETPAADWRGFRELRYDAAADCARSPTWPGVAFTLPAATWADDVAATWADDAAATRARSAAVMRDSFVILRRAGRVTLTDAEIDRAVADMRFGPPEPPR